MVNKIYFKGKLWNGKIRLKDDFELIVNECKKITKDDYEYISHTWGYSPIEKTITYLNKKLNKVYTQYLYDHLKYSLPHNEKSDLFFEDFKEKAKFIHNDEYTYHDFVDTTKPILVINKKTGKRYYQRILHILKGSKPSEEKRRKYTKENCQQFSDNIHKGRFSIDITTFENSNSIVTLTDLSSNIQYKQLYCSHIRGSLPKEISYSNISKKEKQIHDAIKEIFPSFNIIFGYRPKWLKRKEIDIYIPELNIGIEYNRSYLSSFRKKSYK